MRLLKKNPNSKFLGLSSLFFEKEERKMTTWPTQRVKVIKKLDTSPVIAMVQACQEMLENMTIRQFQAFLALDPDEAGEEWLMSPPTRDTTNFEVAEKFALAMSNLQDVLTELRLQAGYKQEEAYDEHPCMQWTAILFDYPFTLDDFSELFEMLELTLRELPDYVEKKKLKPVADIHSKRTKRLEELVQSGQTITLEDLP